MKFQKIYMSKKGSTNGGFTLIELLTVVALIAILAAVILAALGNAKNKGSDAAVKSNLSGTHAQSELYFAANGNSYRGVCDATPTEDGTQTIHAMVIGAAQASGLTSVTINGSGTTSTATCNVSEDGDSWAVEIPMRNKDVGGVGMSTMYAVDSTGFSGYTNDTFGLSSRIMIPEGASSGQ